MASDNSLAGAVSAHAFTDPDALALLAPDREPCSYATLADHLVRVRTRLTERLPVTNRVIAVAVANGPDLLSALVAAMSAGVCAPVDPARPPSEVEAFLADVRPALVLTDDASLARHAAAFQRYGVRVVVLAAEKGREAGVFDLTDVPYAGTPGVGLIDGHSDVVLLVRTSGTTSASKVVPHTMRRLMHIFESIVGAVSLSSSDRCLNARPLHHLHAITHVVGASLVARASVVCPSDVGAAALVAGFRTYEPTWYSASPPVHRDVLAVLRANAELPPHRLRFVRSSSASLDADVAVELEAALGGVPVLQGYGMSEAPAIALNPPPPFARKPGSVGRAVGCELRIVDGEVVVRGANVAPAYATRGETRPILDPRSGWFHTGDSGLIDADGYLFLTGRLNEMINVGGEKVAPSGVERALRAHTAVADAIAFALPHPTLGELVAAAVVVKAGSAVEKTQLIDHAAQRLPRHAVPNVVHVVPSIARDGNGKVRRRLLATALAKDLEAARHAPDRKRSDHDSLRHALTRIWEDVLERTPVELDENFFAAGGDSLRAVRVLARIQASLGVALPADALLSAPTIDALADAVILHINHAQPSRLIALRPSGSRPPLFFFDGDINGGGLYARFLLSTLHPEQPIYVVRPNGALGDDIPERIESMADADAAMIARVVPSAGYRLAGFCNGGVVAFEVARRLEAAGKRVDTVALIASSAPNARLESLWRMASLAARFTSHGDELRCYRPARDIVNTLRADSIAAGARYIVRATWRRIRERLGLAPKPPVQPPAPGRSTAGYLAYRDRLARWFPRPYGRAVDLIWADDDIPRLPGDWTMGWRHVARVTRQSMRGDHTTMLTDHVGELGTALRQILDAADRDGYLVAPPPLLTATKSLDAGSQRSIITASIPSPR